MEHFDIANSKLASIGKRLSKVNSILKKIESPPQNSSFIVQIEDNEPKSCMPLDKDECTIGRTYECDFVISCKKASRIHCKLSKSNENWTIFDSDSRNGIFVNGERITKKTLCDGDIIRIGNVELIFVKKPDIAPFENF
jgi:hypothetical protein